MPAKRVHEDSGIGLLGHLDADDGGVRRYCPENRHGTVHCKPHDAAWLGHSRRSNRTSDRGDDASALGEYPRGSRMPCVWQFWTCADGEVLPGLRRPSGYASGTAVINGGPMT